MQLVKYIITFHNKNSFPLHLQNYHLLSLAKIAEHTFLHHRQHGDVCHTI